MARMNNPGRTFAAYGDSASPNVRELQQVLRQLGVYSGAVTGTFDDATYQAYRRACRAAHLPISRDKKGRLVVTLGDFEALEQLDGGAVDFVAAETQIEAEDDFAKRPVADSKPEDHSSKRPADPVPNRLARQQRKGNTPLIVAWAVAAISLILAGAMFYLYHSKISPSSPKHTSELPAPTTVLQGTVSSSEEAALVPTIDIAITPVPASVSTPSPAPTPIAPAATEATFEGYTFMTTGDGTCSITDYTGNEAQLVIPKELDGFLVVEIGDFAFRECTWLTSVTIPDSVTTIGNNAFYFCTAMTSLTLPDNLQHIGDGAFNGCTYLKSLIIPDSVTALDFNPFKSCWQLTDIIISPNHPALANVGGIIFNRSRDRLIYHPCCVRNSSYVIPDGVTTIGDCAFFDCEFLTNITIPESVTHIEDNAFFGCRYLPSIAIPESVTSIGTDIFRYCDSLTAVYVTENSYAHQYCVENGLPYVLQ